MRLLLAAPLSLLALSLGGCFPGPQADGVDAGNHCDHDSDCSGGTTCDARLHVCTAPGATTEVVLSVSPPANRPISSAATTTSDPQTVAGEGDVDLVLNTARLIYGTVRVPSADNLDTLPIAAELRFRRQGSTPSEDVVVRQSTADLMFAPDGTSYTYSAQLAPGVYDVTITPADLTQYPPYLLTNASAFHVDPDPSGTPMPLDIVYSQLPPITGRLINHATRELLRGLTVRVVDPAHNNAPLSTTGTTDVGGRFGLRLSPNAPAQWALEISSSTAQASGTTTRFVYQISSAALPQGVALTNLQIDVWTTLGLVQSLPGVCTGCVDVEGTMEGSTPDGRANVGIERAAINLHADVGSGQLAAGHVAWFEGQAVTGTDGTFQAQLLPGNYTATVIPDDEPTQHYAVTQFQIPVTGTGPQRGGAWTMRHLVPVRGNVMDRDATVPMANIAIEAVPVGAFLADSARLSPTDAVARPFRTLTAADGSYRIDLDPGTYQLIARPPTSSGFATTLEPQFLQVGWNAQDASSDAPVSIENYDVALVAPLAVTGQVHTDGAMPSPVGDAVISAFARLRFAGGGLLDVDLTQATADGTGRYSLLLPSGLGQ